MSKRGKEYNMTKLTTNNKTVVEVMAELKNKANIKLGKDIIEFPDGSKKEFIYNGEADKNAAVEFAQICLNATNNSTKAKSMMDICMSLMIKNIQPSVETVLGDGATYYIDLEQKLLCDKYGNMVVKLTKEENDITDRKAIIRILEERGERKIWGNN
jgi:hypothetical protein